MKLETFNLLEIGEVIRVKMRNGEVKRFEVDGEPFDGGTLVSAHELDSESPIRGSIYFRDAI